MKKDILSKIVFLLLFFIAFLNAQWDTNFGAEFNPTGDPIGGGKGYSSIYTSSSSEITVVNTAVELINTLQNAGSGDIIYINGNCTIDLNITQVGIDINEGITLASDRGYNGHPGALIRINTCGAQGTAYNLFEVLGSNVRITGLRIQGPDNGDYSIQYKCRDSCGTGTPRGIACYAPGLRVDNCEISQWSHAGVYLSPEPSNTSNAYIHHNYFHHNRHWGIGYSVALGYGKANALIEANIFDWGRHAIAATGVSGNSYEACYNIFLKNHYHYPVDMHGGGDRRDCTNEAGDWIKIHHNSFYTNESSEFPGSRLRGVHIGGTPREGCYIYNNWFLREDQGSCISQAWYVNPCKGPDSLGNWQVKYYTEDLLDKIYIFQNKFGSTIWGSNDLVYGERDLFSDFNGDGNMDLLYIGPYYSFDYFYIKRSTSDGIGFINGTFTNLPGQPNYLECWGGNNPGIDIWRYKIGDFDGVNGNDIISFENDAKFYIWKSNRYAFVGPTPWGQNGADIGTERYKIGNFDGVGGDDIISFESNAKFYVWKSTGSSFTGPTQWGQNGGDIGPYRYKIGDVNGDNKDDLISYESNGNLYVWISNGNGFVNGGNPKTWIYADGEINQNAYKINSNPDLEEISDSDQIPVKFILAQNYPNPFNPVTTIPFTIPEAAKVNILVYNILGQKVFEITNKYYETGTYSVTFNGQNLASGIYILRAMMISIKEPDNKYIFTNKIMLLK